MRLNESGSSLPADIIAVEGNPLQDITVLQQVDFVMKQGEVYVP